MKNPIVPFNTMLVIFLGFGITANASLSALILTEVSSTTLTYSWNGGAAVTVSAITPDYWSFKIPDPLNPPWYAPLIDPSFIGTVNINWQEPDYATSGKVNAVHITQYVDNDNQITVYSDASPDTFGTPYPPFADGFVYSFNTYVPNLFDGNTVQFNDSGDSPVPEPTTFIAGALLILPFGVSLLRFMRKHEGMVERT